MEHTILYLGILAAPFLSPDYEGRTTPPEPRLCRDLTEASDRLSVHAYLFTAEDYDHAAGTLHGWRWQNGEWIRRPVPLPDIVYDRTFFQAKRDRLRCEAALSAIHARKAHRRMNGSLPSKPVVYDRLAEDTRLVRHTPPTVRYAPERLEPFLASHGGSAIIKPAAGMQGRGVILIRQALWDDMLTVKGRTRGNRPFERILPNLTELSARLSRFMGDSPFLIQPYLHLRDSEGRPYDIRALIQKDGDGKWRITGTAARIGRSGSLTSNLHGGGEVMDSFTQLSANFGKPMAERLLHEIHTISGHTANRLEHSFGRFGELAMDFGIEPDGSIWLLEVNSKPGREAFRQTGPNTVYAMSIERPIRYARYLKDRLSPTFTASESAYDLFQPQR
ncbi:YheC/YheD family protein [Paenibacillus sp. 1011MAR3C5]|uniref:YheC/YheD family endospore coat-associated protein n=1 Tax=Paenibacillus sp. 1011MAR3C5 TaxID=1675787 RepID=UPI000E6B6035|nr:YheC/YheD family protein [Paenibacillus sp. 1011MAR3C5]RJE91121.1 YheC/YheD family protein [Paenibacillus sp. 1011MAR3C5]